MSMGQAELEKRLATRGVLVRNSHFVLTPKPEGLFHSSDYFAKDRLLSDPLALDAVAEIMYDRLRSLDIEVVVGPTVGAVSLASMVALKLSIAYGKTVIWAPAEEATEKRRALKPDVGLAVFSEKSFDDVLVPIKSQRVIGRGLAPEIKGRQVVVVEDVLSSGGSAQVTVKAVEEIGGIVVAVCAICNRSGKDANDLGLVSLSTIWEMPMEMYPEETCPLCAANRPIEMALGHGKAFYARHPESAVPKKLAA